MRIRRNGQQELEERQTPAKVHVARKAGRVLWELHGNRNGGAAKTIKETSSFYFSIANLSRFHRSTSQSVDITASYAGYEKRKSRLQVAGTQAIA